MNAKSSETIDSRIRNYLVFGERLLLESGRYCQAFEDGSMLGRKNN